MTVVLKVMPGVTPDAGTERSFLATAPRLIEKGIDLHLALLTPRQTLAPDLERLGVVVHDLSSHTTVLGRTLALRRLVRALNPALIHASLFEATFPAQLASLRSGIPILISWVNTNYGASRNVEPGSTSWKLLPYQLMESVTGRISRSWYHAVTSGVGRFNAESLHVPQDRVFVAERGRDPLVYRPTAPTADSKPKNGHRTILAVGRQEPQKGYRTLLEEFDRLADTHTDVRLKIAGRSGQSTPEIADTRAAMRHSDRVDILGQRFDVPDLMNNADVVVCSSWREGAAGALIEAMACGTPVVTVPLAGTEGILINDANAVVIDRARLAEGIAKVLDNPDFAHRIAGAAATTFTERFTLDAAANRMLDIYQTIIDKTDAQHDETNQPRTK